MEESRLKELIKTKDPGTLLFHINLLVEVKTLKKCELCVTETQLFVIRKYKILFFESFCNLEIKQCIEKRVLNITNDGGMELTAHFKQLNLLNSLYLNLQEKIQIEKDRHLKFKTEGEIAGDTDLDIKSVDLYATVLIGKSSFLIRSNLAGGLNLLRLNIINKLAEMLSIDIEKQLIEMQRYQSIKVYMKYKKKFYKIESDMDLESGAAFSNNRVELILRNEEE